MFPTPGSADPEQQAPSGSVTDPGRLVGVWSLVSFSVIDQAGYVLLLPMGRHPDGLLVYTADGCMSAHLLDPERHSHSADARPTAQPADRTDVEAATSTNTYVGYGGTYDYRRNVVVHHVRVASVPEWINTQQVRHLKLNGDVLTLRSPTLRTGGQERTPCLVWRRLPGPVR